MEKATPAEKTNTKVQLEQVFERVVEGEIEPENFDLVIEDVKAVPRQHKGGSQAGIEPIGCRIFGNVMCGPAIGKMNITSRNGRTRIEIRTGAFFPLFLSLYPTFIISLVSIAITAEKGAPLIGAAIAAALLTGAFPLAKYLLKRGHKAGEELADNLSAKAQEAVDLQNSELQKRLANSTPAPVSEDAPAEVRPHTPGLALLHIHRAHIGSLGFQDFLGQQQDGEQTRDGEAQHDPEHGTVV
ncbi:MAG: hypothetical protein ACK4NQ_09605 [Fimbriimonadaceae bacterium]